MAKNWVDRYLFILFIYFPLFSSTIFITVSIFCLVQKEKEEKKTIYFISFFFLLYISYILCCREIFLQRHRRQERKTIKYKSDITHSQFEGENIKMKKKKKSKNEWK